ncbi:DNA polymerase III subunit delta' [Methylomonas sp. MgM2]
MKESGLPVYPWQHANWEHLLGYIRQQRIPQALLITGPAGVGKRRLADAFAQSLSCHAPSADYSACGHCRSCKLLAAQTHPDYLLIEPDEPGKAIGIDKIRRLIVKLALKPQFEMQRVVIITPADQLNTASANAFLKCLEEPSERTCLVLLTEKPSALPATIRSRCQAIQCHLPEHRLAQRWLEEQGVRENIDTLLTLAGRAPLVAKAFAEQDFVSIRRYYFDAWVQIAEGKKNLLEVSEQWQKSDRLDLSTLLQWMLYWVLDIIKIKYLAGDEQLHNPDLQKSLQGFAERLELKGLYRFYDRLLKAYSQLNTQVNKQLTLEQILIDWSQLNIR